MTTKTWKKPTGTAVMSLDLVVADKNVLSIMGEIYMVKCDRIKRKSHDNKVHLSGTLIKSNIMCK